MFHPFTLNIKGELRSYARPQVMGIVNVTPDSFYKASRTMDCDAVKKRVDDMLLSGVDFIDIGAYSSRPGADDVSTQEEIDRIGVGLEVIRGLSMDIPVSVDTFRSEVAKVAIIEMGADIINDISGGELDERMFDTAAALNAPYVLMHMRGTPATMQLYTDYEDVTADILLDLSKKLRKLHLMGVADVIVDPGFGFSKTLEQNYDIMRSLETFSSQLGVPVLIGVSRKSMIKKALDVSSEDALNGTTVLNTIALMRGAAFLRVHDVREAVQAVKLYELSK
ncbi:MAG: dihydropteroate synthase [Muribaculaceae bacterium]|nr:dihydropteroate synthase [Muribaculaceae bacterium]